MQIQPDYHFGSYLSALVSERTPTAGQDQTDKIRSKETPEYRAILNKAARLLSNPQISALERSQILSLLARGQTAAENGAAGELRNLSNELKKYDPELTVQDTSFRPEIYKSQPAPEKQGQEHIAYQDQSGDAGVSLKYPVAMNQYQAPLAVRAHEGEHVALAQAEALMNNEKVTTYVSIHTGYDHKGRLIITGGETVTITHSRKKPEPLQTGGQVAVIV